MVKFVALAVAAVCMTAQAEIITTLSGTSAQCNGDFICPTDVALVCGVTGATQNTYLNKCVMKCVDDAEYKFKGACLDDLNALQSSCKVNVDDRISCLKSTGCKFSGDEDGGINGDGVLAGSGEQSSTVECWSAIQESGEKDRLFKKRCEMVGRDTDQDTQKCETLQENTDLTGGGGETFLRCERLGCRADLDEDDCLDRGCQYLELQPYCGADGQDSAQANCAGKTQGDCNGACAWKSPDPTCLAGFGGGTDGQNNLATGYGTSNEDGGAQLNENSADESCYGFMPLIDADTGQPKSDPPANEDGKSAKEFCNGVVDKAGNSLCKFTETTPDSPLPWGQCETFNPCASAKSVEDCDALPQCEPEVMADGAFGSCQVKVLGGGNANAVNDQACFSFGTEGNCNGAESNGQKVCAWTTNTAYTCTTTDGTVIQIGPDDACDGDKESTDTNSCQDICQASGKDKSTCQSLGCCYNTVSETQGFCYSKQGDSCDAGFGNTDTDDKDANGGDFMGGGDDNSMDAAASCFQWFNQSACIEEKSEDGKKLAICMWNSNVFKECTGASDLCYGATDAECESSDDCTLKSEDYGFCVKNDPCGAVQGQSECADLADDGCSWEEAGSGGFCIADSNKDAFSGLSSKGTCSYDANAGDDEGAGIIGESDITLDDNSFAGADACRQLIQDMDLDTDAQLATANKTCSRALDLEGNKKCNFVDNSASMMQCQPKEAKGADDGEAGATDPSSGGFACYNYYDESECTLFGSDDCKWAKEETQEQYNNTFADVGDAGFTCEEVVLSAVDKCAQHNGEHSCEDTDGCEFKEVVDLFAGGDGPGDGNPANPSLGVDLTDLTSGEVSTDDMLGIAAACEKGGQDGAEGCGKVTSTDSETGKEVKLCKFTSTTTVFCDASQSPLNNTGGDANPAMCTAMDTTGGVESDCAKENGCEVTSDSYGRCVPLPHKCTTFDADECKADSDCLYNPPDKGLCMESNEVAFFNQTDAQKAKALACRCIADDSVLHFKQDQCEAAGCEFFARSGTPSEGGDVGGTATGNGGDSADGGGGEGQMCSPKDNSNSGEDIDSTIGGSDEEFDECKCIDDENANGCAEANAGTGSSTDGNMESMSVCMGAFFKEPCEAKETKQGDKACDWSESPAQYICIGSDEFCTSADRFIMSTGQLNVTSCESNSKCSKQKVQDASGFCASHNPCTPHSGNPSACASVDGCLYTEEKRCVADLNEFAPCKETTCCYDVVGGDAEGACNAKKMVDGSRACQYYKSRGSRAFCSPKTPDALCEKVDDESITESVCNADDQCVWDEGMDIAGGNCEPFNPCTAEGVGDDETACGDLEADGEKLCLWYEDDFTEESYCVNKENAGVDNAEDLANAILNAGDETTSGSSSCTVLFTQDNCNNAPRGDLTHPKCMYLDGQCLAYDTCRTVNAGESADNCKEAGCSWESNDPTGNNGVCKKKLGEIDSESNFECVPVDIADVSEEEVNIQFSTVKPTTTLDPKGCCVITEGLFNPEVSCEDDFSLSRCVQYGTDMMASGKWGSATLQAATTCADAAAEGVKLCPQGKTTVYVPTTSTVKTTTTSSTTTYGGMVGGCGSTRYGCCEGTDISAEDEEASNCGSTGSGSGSSASSGSGSASFCLECAKKFSDNGGCEAQASNDIEALFFAIPKGCMSCADVAFKYCAGLSKCEAVEDEKDCDDAAHCVWHVQEPLIDCRHGDPDSSNNDEHMQCFGQGNITIRTEDDCNSILHCKSHGVVEEGFSVCLGGIVAPDDDYGGGEAGYSDGDWGYGEYEWYGYDDDGGHDDAAEGCCAIIVRPSTSKPPKKFCNDHHTISECAHKRDKIWEAEQTEEGSIEFHVFTDTSCKTANYYEDVCEDTSSGSGDDDGNAGEGESKPSTICTSFEYQKSEETCPADECHWFGRRMTHCMPRDMTTPDLDTHIQCVTMDHSECEEALENPESTCVPHFTESHCHFRDEIDCDEDAFQDQKKCAANSDVCEWFTKPASGHCWPAVNTAFDGNAVNCLVNFADEKECNANEDYDCEWQPGEDGMEGCTNKDSHGGYDYYGWGSGSHSGYGWYGYDYNDGEAEPSDDDGGDGSGGAKEPTKGCCKLDKGLFSVSTQCHDGHTAEQCKKKQEELRAAGSFVYTTFYLSEVCSEATFECATSCSSNEFTCHNVDADDDSQCVPVHWECDGEKDCTDGSDEEDCDKTTTTVDTTSADGGYESPYADDDANDGGAYGGSSTCEGFTCHDFSNCIPKSWECDGEKDCRDGSDEEDCGGSTCASGQFTCSNKNCIPAAWACDEWPDCSDGSDEKDCGPDTKTTRRTSTPYTTTTTTTKTTRPTTTYIPGSCEAVGCGSRIPQSDCKDYKSNHGDFAREHCPLLCGTECSTSTSTRTSRTDTTTTATTTTSRTTNTDTTTTITTTTTSTATTTTYKRQNCNGVLESEVCGVRVHLADCKVHGVLGELARSSCQVMCGITCTTTSTTTTTATTTSVTSTTSVTDTTTSATVTTETTTTYIPQPCNEIHEAFGCGTRIPKTDCVIFGAHGDFAREHCPTLCELPCTSTSTTTTATTTTATTTTTTTTTVTVTTVTATTTTNEADAEEAALASATAAASDTGDDANSNSTWYYVGATLGAVVLVLIIVVVVLGVKSCQKQNDVAMLAGNQAYVNPVYEESHQENRRSASLQLQEAPSVAAQYYTDVAATPRAGGVSETAMSDRARQQLSGPVASHEENHDC